MRNKLIKLALAVTLSSAAVTANAAWTFNILQSLSGDTNSTASSINNSGQIVGVSSNGPDAYRGVLWNSTSLTPTLLQPLSGNFNSGAASINNSGQIVGFSQTSSSGYGTATLWSSASPSSPSQLQNVQSMTNPDSWAYRINNSGQIVGYTNDATYKAQLWDGVNVANTRLGAPNSDNFVAAYSINDSGAIVGSSGAWDNPKPILWSSSTPSSYTILGTLGTLPQGSTSDINNSGSIVGYSQMSTDLYQATLWNSTAPSSPTLLASLGGEGMSGWANAINNSGKIVGASTYANVSGVATLWDGTSVIDLNFYLDASNNPDGWVLTEALDINDNGAIIGTAYNSVLGNKSFLLQSVTPVPEADTSAMLLMGAGVMGFMARRRKNTQA